VFVFVSAYLLHTNEAHCASGSERGHTRQRERAREGPTTYSGGQNNSTKGG